MLEFEVGMADWEQATSCRPSRSVPGVSGTDRALSTRSPKRLTSALRTSVREFLSPFLYSQLIAALDTAQAYRNEVEAGKALAKVDRSKVFITTKYSGLDGLDIDTSIRNSLKNVRTPCSSHCYLKLMHQAPIQLGTDYVDLYLIHHPRLAKPDIPTAWARMEALQATGLVRSIGVSNYEVADLAILLASAKVKPAANQVRSHIITLLLASGLGK